MQNVSKVKFFFFENLRNNDKVINIIFTNEEEYNNIKNLAIFLQNFQKYTRNQNLNLKNFNLKYYFKF